MAKPKIAVLGLGSIGKRHLSNLMSMDIQCRGWDPEKPSKLDRMETIMGADAVIIASPTRQHMNDMIDCGGKHLLVEKPIAFDAPSPMLEGFYRGKRSKGEFVCVGNNLRFHHVVRDVKKMIEGGLIGKIGWAEFWVLQKTEKPPYLMDGVSRNWGAHEIDLALYLLGPGIATEVKDCRTINGCDVDITFSMKHENDCHSELHMDYITEPEKRGFRLCGTTGTIEADLVARTIKVSTVAAVSINQCKDTFDQNYKDELKEFIDVIQGKPLKNSPIATGLDGAKCMDIILSVRSMAGLVDKPEEER